MHGGASHTFEVHPEFEVLSIKALVEDASGLPIDEQRILHKGRVMKDEDTLESQGNSRCPPWPPPSCDPARLFLHRMAGVMDDAQLYVGRHSGTSPEVPASALVPQPGQDASASADPMAQLLNSPLMQGMLDNPEVMRSMLHANPQFRQVMENNPEVAHMLNDPEVLRQSLASARNPQLMREMTRNSDRALSNIEAHPGGHNMLRRMYQTVQAPLYEGAAMGGQAQAQQPQQPQQPQQQQDASSGPNTSALPNPWAAPQQQNPFGGGDYGFGFGGGFGR